jgi:hypothetical protein
MIKVKHPDPERNKHQEELLASLPPAMRHYHELMFTYGNITYRYHQEAKNFKPTEEDWQEWIEGLPENMRNAVQKEGFEKCKSILSFTRYVNEKHDVGLDEYVRLHMDVEDYQEWQTMNNNTA